MPGATLIIKHLDRISTFFIHRYGSPTTRFQFFQWTVISLVSFFLGLYILVALTAPLLGTIFLLGLVLSPFIFVIAIRIAGNLKTLLLIVILLEIPINVDINYMFNDTIAEFDTVSGFNVSLTTLCLALLYARWFAEVVSRRPRPSPFSFPKISSPLIVYFTVVVLSIFMARVPLFSLFEINILIQAVLIYIYVLHAIQTREDLHLVITFLLIGLFLESLIMIGSRALGTTVDFGIIRFHVDPRNLRVGGTIGSPNSAGSYLTLMLIIALSVISTQMSVWHKRLAAVSLGLGTVALILTLSRGAWGSFALGAVLFWFFAWRRGWLSLRIPIVMFICAIPITIVLRDFLITRLFESDGGSAASRLPLLKMAMYMIRDHWLLGVGSNNYAATLLDYLTPEFSMEWIVTVHNKYMIVWAETGIVGLIAFIWFLIETINHGWQVGKLNDRFLSPLALGFVMSMVAWMVHMNLEHFHNRPQVQLLLLVAGIITAMYNMAGLTSEPGVQADFAKLELKATRSS